MVELTGIEPPKVVLNDGDPKHRADLVQGVVWCECGWDSGAHDDQEVVLQQYADHLLRAVE